MKCASGGATEKSALCWPPATAAPRRGASHPAYYSVIIDITEYKRLLERNEREVKDALLTRAQAASESKSRFGPACHELRTPLNAVIGMNRLAIHRQDDAKELQTAMRK